MTTFLSIDFKTGLGWSPYLLQLYSSQEIVMAPSRKRIEIFIVAISAVTVWASAACASQGPGGGLGSASGFTQTVMAILVWGMSALVVGAGLIGALRRR